MAGERIDYTAAAVDAAKSVCICPGEVLDGTRAGGAEAKRTLGRGPHRATGTPSMGDHGQSGLVEEFREKRALENGTWLNLSS